MKNIIYIHKTAGKKDAVRISSSADIPEFLQETITIRGEKIHLGCVEGDEVCPLGSVIGWEQSNSTATGYNCWCIGNAAESLIEKDGTFYKKPVIYKAAPLGETAPDFIRGANADKFPGGIWKVKTDWGESSGKIGEAYWVLYGIKADGTPDVNILTKTEKSYQDYIVCDENGNDIGALGEIDPA